MNYFSPMIIFSFINLSIAAALLIRATVILHYLATKPRPPLCYHCIPGIRIVQMGGFFCFMYLFLQVQWAMNYLGVVPTSIDISWMFIEFVGLLLIGVSQKFSFDVLMGKFAAFERQICADNVLCNNGVS
jgi:hypothetical protein